MIHNFKPRAAIRSIEIKNFRSIDSLSLSFVGPDDEVSQTIVIGGPNGSGKTSVLEACLIAAQHQELVAASSEVRAKHLYEQDFSLQAELQVANTRIKVRRIGSKSSYEVTSGEARPLEPSLAPCAYFSSWRAPKLIGSISVTAGKKGKRPSSQNEVNRLWLIKQFLVNAKAHESMSPSVRLPGFKSPYDELISRLNMTWSLFHPHQEFHFAVEPVSTDVSEGFDVFLSTADKRISVDQLSSGELELFGFAAWMIAERFEGGIICLDEPELHLDPQWHPLLLEALRRLQPDSQFIVATHSPDVFDSVSSYERHLLIPKDDPRRKYWNRSTG